MEIIKTADAMQSVALGLRARGRTIALVPTMGYLHAGHTSLLDAARPECDVLIASIFVNPTQFAPDEDLDKYPRDFSRDCELCEAHGVDYVFAPEVDAMYAPDRSTWVVEETLSKPLCGRTRPIHFRGVATVVTKLFNICQPNVAVFGRKDAQQALIVKRVVRDLNMPVRIVVAPLVRDDDGVALSSRNRYLSRTERAAARSISLALLEAENALNAGGAQVADELAREVARKIEESGGKVDYVEALDAANLSKVTASTREVLVAAAAYFGNTRLIDNILVEFDR